MVIDLRMNARDEHLRQILGALEQYNEAHPQADIAMYRQNSVSVRIRVVDSDFEHKSRSQREEEQTR